jgi:hypothetical protein
MKITKTKLHCDNCNYEKEIQSGFNHLLKHKYDKCPQCNKSFLDKKDMSLIYVLFFIISPIDWIYKKLKPKTKTVDARLYFDPESKQYVLKKKNN